MINLTGAWFPEHRIIEIKNAPDSEYVRVRVDFVMESETNYYDVKGDIMDVLEYIDGNFVGMSFQDFIDERNDMNCTDDNPCPFCREPDSDNY